MIVLKQPRRGQIISLLTDSQRVFLQAERASMSAEAFDYLNLNRETDKDASFPRAVSFEWEGARSGCVQLSESVGFETACVQAGSGACLIDNLKSGRRYYWRVISGGEISEVSFFDTADDFPRFIRVEGMTNVRDGGCWKTESGRRIRQGLLYRGSEMNAHVTVTERGLQTMREVLGIHSVLDLRGESEEVRDVYQGHYLNVPATPYAAWFEHPQQARAMFEFLFNEDNYPVYFHCWGGADRTGTLAFFLGALLGMTRGDLIDDYEITTLSIWGVRSRNSALWQGFMQAFEALPGETLCEKAEAHVRACGLDQAQIEAFRSFMLEPEIKGELS